jgi:hypothetical protein
MLKYFSVENILRWNEQSLKTIRDHDNMGFIRTRGE